MQYSLLQKNLETPDAEKLKRAFRSVPGFVAADAHTLANDSLGVLLKHQTQEDALKLQRALRMEGMDTEIVAEAALIPIPPSRVIKRVACRPDALIIYDALDREVPVPWHSVLMIAAGSVRLTDSEKLDAKREIPVLRTGAMGLRSESSSSKTVISVEGREQQNYNLMLEIITGRAENRFSIKADASSVYLFQYLGARRTKSLWENFTLLVQDLAKYAQNSALNSGAYYLKEGSEEVFSYPTKLAFMEEMTWLLWQMANQSRKK
jgi:hypothetical protein